ncbi:MAG: hypothetical protein RR905_02780 [Aurantimicrobium sp.]
MRLKKTLAVASIAVMSAIGLTACQDADVVSHNLSKDSDNFKVERRVVFFNGITDKYLLEMEGRCSILADGTDSQLEVTCKTGDDEYKKHFLGLSDNVSYLVEQTEAHESDPYHYKLTFKPEVIIPDIDLRTSGGDK